MSPDDYCTQGCDQSAHPDDGGCAHGLGLCASHTDYCFECRIDKYAAEYEFDRDERREKEALG